MFENRQSSVSSITPLFLSWTCVALYSMFMSFCAIKHFPFFYTWTVISRLLHKYTGRKKDCLICFDFRSKRHADNWRPLKKYQISDYWSKYSNMLHYCIAENCNEITLTRYFVLCAICILYKFVIFSPRAFIAYQRELSLVSPAHRPYVKYFWSNTCTVLNKERNKMSVQSKL